MSGVPDEGMSDVVDGNLSYPSWIPSGNQTITITGNIKPAPGSGEKIAYYYVVGGNLQRKIKLVLRPPYNFINPRFENVKAGAGTNVINGGLKQDVYLKFSIPEDIDESLFPIEYKIYTKKLYAVEPGVRLETTGAKDWCYVYTDQVFSKDEKVIHFKTNTANEGEGMGDNDKVFLKADLFNAFSALTYSRKAPTTISPTIAGNVTGGSSSWNGYTVRYKINNIGSENSFICGSGGAYSIALKNVLSTDVVYFYYSGNSYWSCQKSVSHLIEDGNILMSR